MQMQMQMQINFFTKKVLGTIVFYLIHFAFASDHFIKLFYDKKATFHRIKVVSSACYVHFKTS